MVLAGVQRHAVRSVGRGPGSVAGAVTAGVVAAAASGPAAREAYARIQPCFGHLPLTCLQDHLREPFHGNLAPREAAARAVRAIAVSGQLGAPFGDIRFMATTHSIPVGALRTNGVLE